VTVKTLIMIALAIVFGGLSVIAANRWLSRQASLQRQQFATQPAQAPVPTGTIVVAAAPLRYGTELSERQLREAPWASEKLPAGAYKTIAEVLAGNGKRVVLSAIEANEPVLQSKVTGPGQRGTLSALIEDGMGAVTVHVNEVVGVAGFVLPGDRVDVLLTRQIKGNDLGPSGQAAFTDVVLRNVRVLAAGQTADDKADKPSVVSAVTLEVDSIGAQKIAVAVSAGSLSLMLRKAGDLAAAPLRRVSLNEVGHDPKGMSDQRVVRVTRATQPQEYTVPVASVADVQRTTAAGPNAEGRPQVAESR
jgi:pilus assembly protein CpaB